MRTTAADLTFAVIGGGEVGEFPQQPSLVGVPATADNHEKQSARFPTCSLQPAETGFIQLMNLLVVVFNTSRLIKKAATQRSGLHP